MPKINWEKIAKDAGMTESEFAAEAMMLAASGGIHELAKTGNHTVSTSYDFGEGQAVTLTVSRDEVVSRTEALVFMEQTLAAPEPVLTIDDFSGLAALFQIVIEAAPDDKSIKG